MWMINKAIAGWTLNKRGREYASSKWVSKRHKMHRKMEYVFSFRSFWLPRPLTNYYDYDREIIKHLLLSSSCYSIFLKSVEQLRVKKEQWTGKIENACKMSDVVCHYLPNKCINVRMYDVAVQRAWRGSSITCWNTAMAMTMFRSFVYYIYTSKFSIKISLYFYSNKRSLDTYLTNSPKVLKKIVCHVGFGSSS